MDLGLFFVNGNALATDPAAAARVAAAAEAAGWESLWTGEHYVLPEPRTPASPADPATPMLDPFVALAFLAAHTTTLRLATGVTVVPVHHPVVLAKQVASLDRVSGGRVLFGVGVGYLEPEFSALGVPLADRGRRTDEYLDAMAALWAGGGPAAFAGRHVSFAGVRAEPGPVQRPGPPLHVGGLVTASFRRAVTRGHGWYGYALDLEATARCLGALRAVLAEHGRPPGLGPLEITVTPHPSVTVDEPTVAAYAELGVTRLVLLPPPAGARDPGEILRFMDDVGVRLAGAR